EIGSGTYDDFIQIDAPVNKGNSGGPAFNMQGEVVGVNTAIYSPSGGSVGIAFSIPAMTVKNVIAQLKDNGSVSRGWIGVQIQPVTQDIADGMGLKQAQGALVADPQKDGPAAKAGVEAGDVITAANGQSVKDARELARIIGSFAPDSVVKLDVLHKGKNKVRSEEHTSELQSRVDLVCRLLLEKKKHKKFHLPHREYEKRPTDDYACAANLSRPQPSPCEYFVTWGS